MRGTARGNRKGSRIPWTMPVDLNDLVFLVGLGILGAGLWLWWPPASLMITGGILVLAAFLRAWGAGRGGRQGGGS